jgi:hypothetical protein
MTLVGKIIKIILKGSLVIWGAALGLRAALEMIYFDYPRQPNPAMGRTVPYMIKNIVVYITGNQNDVLYWLRWCFYPFGVLLVISAILNEIWSVRSKNSGT